MAVGSCFLGSFVPGVNDAPNGLGCSATGLEAFLAAGATVGNEPLGEGLEVDENFELMLDIHELRRPGEAVTFDLVSLGPLGDV